MPAGVARRRLIAPPLLWFEASSALHELGWRKEVRQATARAGLDWLLAAPIERRAPDRLIVHAWELADRFGWAKTYDAEYVALAELEGCPLLTVDARLRRGAARVVEVVGPTDL